MAVGILEVQLMNAKGLRDIDFFGQGGHPVWNDRLTFKVEYPGQGGEYKLSLKIMDKDTFSSDDFIGGATIYVKDLLTSGVQNGTAELHPSKYRVVDASQSFVGEIQVGVTFTLKEEQIYDGEENGGWNESSF